jgi:putative tricarboxylic transport membrane protein
MARSANLLAAAVAAAVAVLLFALTFGFEQMPVGLTQGLGAEFFPRLVLGTILALSVALALTSAPRGDPLPPTAPLVYVSAVALVAFMAGVWLIGMLPAMFVFMVGLGLVWGERRLPVLLASSTLVTFAVWSVFVYAFRIPLPQGYLLALPSY